MSKSVLALSNILWSLIGFLVERKFPFIFLSCSTHLQIGYKLFVFVKCPLKMFFLAEKVFSNRIRYKMSWVMFLHILAELWVQIFCKILCDIFAILTVRKFIMILKRTLYLCVGQFFDFISGNEKSWFWNFRVCIRIYIPWHSGLERIQHKKNVSRNLSMVSNQSGYADF